MALNKFFFLFLVCFICNSCKVTYNLTGGGVPEDVQTLSFQNFVNESAQGPATLGQNLTEKIKNYYQSNTRLKQVPADGDWQMDGKIINYAVTPVAPQANETAGSNRLTITVKVNFLSLKNDKHKFNENFSFYRDFPQSQTLTAVEGELVEEILNQIVYDIFIKTVSLDW
jgi:hypothetical protein